MENKWRVTYGIHCGTLMSRDSTTDTFDTEADARKFLDEIVMDYQPGKDRFGYVLWFASLWNPDGERIEQINGYPYY